MTGQPVFARPEQARQVKRPSRREWMHVNADAYSGPALGDSASGT